MSGRSPSLPSAVNLNEVDSNNEKMLVKDETTMTNKNNSTYLWKMELNTDTVITGLYILAAVSSIVIVYFVVKAIRLRRRNYKVRRYGVIASREDVEMTPLENEDDDEDSTVFDISIKNHSRS